MKTSDLFEFLILPQRSFIDLMCDEHYVCCIFFLPADSSSSQLFLTSPSHARNLHFNSGQAPTPPSQPAPGSSLQNRTSCPLEDSSPLLSSGHAQMSRRLDHSTGLSTGSSVSTSMKNVPVNLSTGSSLC